MKKFFALLLLALSLSANAGQAAPLPEKQCDAQIPFGEPLSAKQDTTLVCRKAYLLEHDNKAKIPQWVSYVLTPEHTTGCVKRSNAFAADESLPSRATPKDYAKSGYDIGHQANDGDMSWDEQVERESFILSNMAPQLPGFNRGIWKQLEDQTRAWARNRNHSLHIYVGPIYGKQDKTIGNGVVVPHAFFKVITDMETHEIIVTEFVHEASKAKLSTFITSLAQVQKDSGLVLPLPKDGKFSTEMWSSATKSIRASKGAVCSLR
jgi:endonuclease G